MPWCIFASQSQKTTKLICQNQDWGTCAQVERNLLQNKENLFEAHASLSGSLHGPFSGEGSQDARESPQEQHGKENGVK